MSSMTPDDLTAFVLSGRLTHRQAIAVYSALYGAQGAQPEAPALTLPCEHCGTLTPLSHMVSYKLWTPMAGHPAVAGYDEHDQHLACSQDCAEQLVANCLAFHLRPEAERRVRAAVTAEAPAFQPGPDGALSADVPEPVPTPTETPTPPPPPTQGEGVPGI